MRAGARSRRWGERLARQIKCPCSNKSRSSSKGTGGQCPKLAVCSGRGEASAEVAITALALAQENDGTIHWTRAARQNSSTMTVEFRVSPASDWVTSLASILTLRIDEAHVSTSAALTSTAPFQFSLDYAQTGSARWLAKVRAAGRTRLGAFFVAQDDTRAARNHIWHLRKDRSSTSERFTAALNFGRTGHFQAER